MVHGQGLVLPTESTSASETHILDVNFDCLHEIFSLQCLSILDLCSIGESHNSFKEVVDYVFAKRHNNYSVTVRKTINLKETTRILNNFCPFISHLLIDRGYYVDNEKCKQLLELVTEYCRRTLDSLQLSYLTVSESQTIILKPIFDKLQKISLNQCTIYSGKTLFSDCHSLVELKLECVKFHDQRLVLRNTFPKLCRFEFSCSYNYENLFGYSNQLNDFFSRHPNLKSLTLYPDHEISLLLPGIADNCKQLEELVIHITEHDVDDVKLEEALTCIVSLDHLKKLVIDCGLGRHIAFIKILEDLKLLEILCLWGVYCDSELAPVLSKLTKLKELELCGCRGLTNLNELTDLERLTELKIYSDGNLVFDLIHTIKRLINLKTLYLDVLSFRMDQTMYQQIVDAVRERPGRIQNALQISCRRAEDFSADSFDDGDCRELVRIIKL